MKIKMSITERAFPKVNAFNIIEGTEKYNEVVVRAYVPRTGESVTMSFPRERSKYSMSSPEVKAAIKKCEKMTTDSLQKHLDEKIEKLKSLTDKKQ